MGPSGCGKSTLLNILGLLDNPTGGKYFLNGTEVGGYTESQRTSLRKGVIGFVFQSFNLIDELNVFENIELPLLYLGVPSADVSGKWRLPWSGWGLHIVPSTSRSSCRVDNSNVWLLPVP